MNIINDKSTLSDMWKHIQWMLLKKLVAPRKNLKLTEFDTLAQRTLLNIM